MDDGWEVPLPTTHAALNYSIPRYVCRTIGRYQVPIIRNSQATFVHELHRRPVYLREHCNATHTVFGVHAMIVTGLCRFPGSAACALHGRAHSIAAAFWPRKAGKGAVGTGQERTPFAVLVSEPIDMRCVILCRFAQQPIRLKVYLVRAALKI